MKCQVKASPSDRGLGGEILGAVLAQQREARLAQRAELLERTYFTAASSVTPAGSRPASRAAASISPRTRSAFARTRPASRPVIRRATRPRPAGP
jgi:hypothetical protein